MKVKLINVAIVTALGLTMAPLHAEDDQMMNNTRSNDIDATGTMTNDVDKTENDMKLDSIDAEDFVDTASAKGIAEIETARMALKDGTAQVHDFANRMVKDHTKANEELKSIAQQANLEVSDDPTLMDKAKSMILSIRDGESFDEAYINNQITAHEQTIELFERGANSDNAQIQAFAREKLPTLREHLQMAKDLKAQQDRR